jgi:acetolactate synthase-1/2/3 large subunit
MVPESLGATKRKTLNWLLRSLPNMPPALARAIKRKVAP